MPTASPSDRKYAPIFVMGCHRSGTNLIYDMLLSSGGFAIHRGYLPLYKKLIPRFGSMENRANREKILATWMRSKGFRRYGLDPAPLSAHILNDCRTGGDFIRAVMDSLAQNQQAQRWALYDPDNVMHVEQVKRDIPNAIFLHIIRDGRDIALSLKKMEGFSPLPWDRSSQTNSLVATALYWEWMIQQGRARGSKFPADYIEIRYEDLITNPRETLGRLGGFIDHDLDYDRIQSAGLGRLSETNSSFREEGKEKIKPLGRWKERLGHADVAAIEASVEKCLEENGYELSLPEAERRRSWRQSSMRRIYPVFFDAKLWLKVHTPFGKLADLSMLELQDEPVQAAAESVRS